MGSYYVKVSANCNTARVQKKKGCKFGRFWSLSRFRKLTLPIKKQILRKYQRTYELFVGIQKARSRRTLRRGQHTRVRCRGLSGWLIRQNEGISALKFSMGCEIMRNKSYRMRERIVRGYIVPRSYADANTKHVGVCRVEQLEGIPRAFRDTIMLVKINDLTLFYSWSLPVTQIHTS